MTAPIARASLATISPPDAAALWRVRLDAGLPVEAGLFDEWLHADPAHAAAWAAVSETWALFDDADDAAFADLRRAALADRPARRSHDVRHHWRPAAAAAAVVALVAAGVQFARNPASPPPQVASGNDAAPGGERYEGPADRSRDIALSDGTRMTLGARARVRVLLAGNRRQVALERGMVTLAVAHDASRPFAVVAQGRRIVDVGTRFRVAVERGEMRVALFEGAVRVEGGAATTMLAPEQQLLVRPGRRDVITRIAPADAGKPEMIRLNDVTLATAAETISAGSPIRLIVPDPKVARLRLSGRFHAGDPERFARSAAVLLSVRMVRVSATRIELRAR